MNIEKIHAQMEEYVRLNEMAGGALTIRKNGSVAFKSKWGYFNVEKKTPIEYNTLFRLASLTKPVTAVGVLKLIEQGKIGLDDELAKYLPEFSEMRVAADDRYVLSPEAFDMTALIQKMLAFREDDLITVPADRQITIRDLLTHTGGIEMGIVGLILQRKMNFAEDTLETRAKKYSQFPLDFQPGTATGYSGHAGMDILAAVIETVSDRTFDEYMHGEIFAPLHMKDTTYHPDEKLRKRLPPLYKTENGAHIDVTGTPEDIDGIGFIGPNFTSASAGLYSTLEDFDRFGQMLANEGELEGVRILKPETVRMIYTEGAYRPLEMEPGMQWGLGMIVRKDPDKAGINVTKDTYGWSGAYGTHFFISPKDRLEVVYVMNRSNIGGASSYISKRLEELVFE